MNSSSPIARPRARLPARACATIGKRSTAGKKFPPAGCITELAAALGIELLDEAQYLALQELGEFDTKTSSWLKTPPEIRALGGAIYGDRRYNRVFIGHNGADSYYSGRGFRGMLRV